MLYIYVTYVTHFLQKEFFANTIA